MLTPPPGRTLRPTTWGPWISLSTDASSGDYLNLAQGATGTWSSLYNAYYETVIGVSLVPDEVAANQAAFYQNQLTTYGMPLETDAGDLNKTAWLFYLPSWLASYPIAGEFISRNAAYINDTPSLVPYGDRYHTSTATEISGIEAHPTLGAVFALLAAGVSLPSRTADSAPPVTPVSAPATPVSVTVTASAGKPKPTLTIYISDGGLTLSGKDVSIRVRSSKAAPCHGSLKLAYTHELALKDHKRKRVSTVIGRANYSLRAGSSHAVKIKLTAAGLRLLRDSRGHRLPVVLTATVVGGMSTSKRTTVHEPTHR
jgi:hypothetical protein